MSSPNGSFAGSMSTISLNEQDLPSHHRPLTAEPNQGRDRDRTMSFSNRSLTSLDSRRRHSGEMTVAAAMSAIVTGMPGASHMMGQNVIGHHTRARASSSAFPIRTLPSPGSPSVLRSLSANSPTRLTNRALTSHPRPASAATFAPVPETTVTPDLSQPPSPQTFAGGFSSALPMSDSEPSPNPSRSNSRHSSKRSDSRRSENRTRSTLQIAQDSTPLFLAVSMYEFNIDKQRREAGFPYLTYVQGELFDVSIPRV